jgi:hypothetical protein
MDDPRKAVDPYFSEQKKLKMRDLTKKKNIQELLPFHVIAHDLGNEETFLAKIKRNQDHRRRLLEIH